MMSEYCHVFVDDQSENISCLPSVSSQNELHSSIIWFPLVKCIYNTHWYTFNLYTLSICFLTDNVKLCIFVIQYVCVRR